MTKVLIIGFGSQAISWAKNLKDSATQVTIGLRDDSTSLTIAQKDFEIIKLSTEINRLREFSTIILLTPDDSHQQILEQIHTHLQPSTRIIYAHGYSLDKEKLNETYPAFSHLLLAPKAIASEVRALYLARKPIPAAFSLEHSKNLSEDMTNIETLAKNLGMTGKLIQTTFSEETICDLYSEQSLLCSTLPYLIKLSFDNLVKKGISPELAFLECCLESKYILNTLLKVGFADFFDLISPNALIGAEKATNMLFTPEFEQKFADLLHTIQNQEFYKEIEDAETETIRKKMVSLYEEGVIEKTRVSLTEYLT